MPCRHVDPRSNRSVNSSQGDVPTIAHIGEQAPKEFMAAAAPLLESAVKVVVAASVEGGGGGAASGRSGRRWAAATAARRSAAVMGSTRVGLSCMGAAMVMRMVENGWPGASEH